MKSLGWSLLALVCLAGVARADVVMLKNGDRITGTLETIKGGTLTMKSEILGELSIPMAKVASYKVDKPVAVVVKGKEPIHGMLEVQPSGAYQVTSNGQQQTIPAAAPQLIMPAAAYDQLVVSPKVWQAWKGMASLGESIQHGNQQTNTFTTTINAVRERPALPIFSTHTRTTFTMAALLSNATQDSVSVVSHTLSTALREDLLFTPDNFFFGLGQIDHISTENLYLRQTVGGGLGRDVINSSKIKFNVIGGLTYQHQKFFNGEFQESASGLLGETLGYQISKRMRLDHSLTFYPDFSQLGQYNFNTTTAFSLKLINRLSLNASVIDLYLSTPPPGSQTNNITVSTGVGYIF